MGCPPPDPFDTPMSEALPLADQPHLLQPNARREDLFGIPKQPVTLAASGKHHTKLLMSYILRYQKIYLKNLLL